MIKSENVALAMGTIVEQVLKICNDEQKANHQLYQMYKCVEVGELISAIEWLTNSHPGPAHICLQPKVPRR